MVPVYPDRGIGDKAVLFTILDSKNDPPDPTFDQSVTLVDKFEEVVAANKGLVGKSLVEIV